MGEDQIVESGGNSCWYDRGLRDRDTSCSGQAVDFSDHIVLYYAQILPIPLTEVLFSFVAPFWRSDSFSRSTQLSSSSPVIELTPIILITGLLYLYVVSFAGTYSTAAYFHTRLEVAIGFSVSLIVQIPLFLMQSTALMADARDYSFGGGMRSRA